MAHGSSKKVANGLVAASCAAVLAVYTAGYTRTRDAADRLDARAIERRAAVSSAPRTLAPSPETTPVAAPAPVPAVKALSHATESKATSPKVADVTPVAEPPAPLVVTPVNAPVTAPVAPTVVPPVTHPAPAPAAAAAPAVSKPNLPPWRDGEYLGWGSSRHGDIQAAVVIADGRIVSTTIAQCKTMYSCYVIEKLPPQPPQRQSPDVDTISGASESSDAFYWAVMDALTKAK